MDQATETIAQRIRAASAAGSPLQIRGGGSKDFLGSLPRGELLQTKDLCGIVAYEPSELVVTVRAGTPLQELEAALAASGQYLPFEPPHFGAPSAPSAPPPPPPGAGVQGGGAQDSAAAAASKATAGGMLASGLSGPARASAGALRDHVLGVTMLNGRGELLVFGGQVMKNVAGYDLSRLMVGAMGTLGLIVNMSLKVLPLPPQEATLRFDWEQDAALQALRRWNAQALPLNASCWVEDEGRPMFFVRLRGALAAVESACKRMGGERMDRVATAGDWEACRQQQLPFFRKPAQPGLSLWRLSVPPATPCLTLPHAQLIEWHGGLRWSWAGPDQAEQLRAAAQSAGGHASLFRAADDAQRQGGTMPPLPAASWRIQRELKRQFDPAGIFNPDRLYPGL